MKRNIFILFFLISFSIYGVNFLSKDAALKLKNKVTNIFDIIGDYNARELKLPYRTVIEGEIKFNSNTGKYHIYNYKKILTGNKKHLKVDLDFTMNLEEKNKFRQNIKSQQGAYILAAPFNIVDLTINNIVTTEKKSSDVINVIIHAKANQIYGIFKEEKELYNPKTKEYLKLLFQ